MKTALIAIVGASVAVVVGCGDPRPTRSPTTTLTTTETTTTTSAPARRNVNGTTAARPHASSDSAAQAPLESSRAAYDAPPESTAAASTAPAAQNPGAADGTKDATNTKVNERDRHGALTPLDQGGGRDRDITANIRRAVVSDGSLSFTAKNVKIITVAGKVTLRGPVKSDAERATIESKAKAAPGVAEVDNQLEVKK